MRIARRLALLEHLYAVYDRFCRSLGDLACRRLCDHCCSRHVTMTTLEGLHLMRHLDAAQRAACLTALKGVADEAGFRPRWTTNQIAARCREGHEPPQEEVIHDGSRCRLLDDGACSLYALRPFGCRCMVSRSPCGPRGYADLDDWVLTVNTVFLQTIEHIDRPGCFGNIRDVLLALAPAEGRSAYEAGHPPSGAPGLIVNHAAPLLLVPPEHRGRMRPLLEEMQQGLGM